MQERSDTGTVSAVTDVSVSLSPEMSRRLQELAQHHQLTVNTVIQGAWALLLSKYAHRSDVLFGVTVAGRPAELAGIQETVGIFVNTLPLRVQVPEPGSAQTVIGWLKSVLAQNVQMRRHEHLPLSEIQSLSAMPRGQSLFDSFVVFENAPGDAALGGHAQEVSAQLRKTRTHTNYPITVMVLPGTQLQLHVIYQRALFDHELIQQLARHFLAVVEACVANPLRTVSDLPMLSAEEVEQGLSAGEGAARTADLDRSYVRLFEEQVQRHGPRIAVRCGTDELRYTELNRCANRVGHALHAAGVREDDLVGVLTDRDLALLTSVLGVFKAGGAYLALDPALPARRLGSVLQSGEIGWVICSERHVKVLRAVTGADVPASTGTRVRAGARCTLRVRPIRA